MFACNGILFNHESPRRGETFVTRKVGSKLICRLQMNLHFYAPCNHGGGMRVWVHVHACDLYYTQGERNSSQRQSTTPASSTSSSHRAEEQAW